MCKLFSGVMAANKRGYQKTAAAYNKQQAALSTRAPGEGKGEGLVKVP